MKNLRDALQELGCIACSVLLKTRNTRQTRKTQWFALAWSLGGVNAGVFTSFCLFPFLSILDVAFDSGLDDGR